MSVSNPGATRRLIIVAIAALALLGLGGVLVATIGGKAPQKTPPLQARIELAAGAVKVDTGEGPVPVVSGAPLRVDAKVAAAEGSRALIRLSDGTGLFLRGGTSLQLAADGTRLEAGQLWMDAAAADRTPPVHRVGEVTVSAAGAGVELTRAGELVTVYVARGLATVEAPGGRVEVQAGERATIKGSAAPEVKPVTFWEDWTGGMADHAAAAGLAGAGAGTLYGVDFGGAPGAAAQSLEISHQAIHAVIRDGLAETEVDQTFFNPGGRAVEGWYWFSIPPGAHVTGFALDSDGQLIEGELIEKTEAKRQYEESAATGHQPALLEWVDGHTFRARIFPVPAAGSRRAVLRYLQRLPQVEGRLRFVHPLQSREPHGPTGRIGEFALTVDLGEAGTKMEISTLEDARIEEGGRLVTMRRSGYKPLADFQLEARLKAPVPPIRVSRFATGGDSADYLMMRWVPDIEWNTVEAQKAEVVVVVDTSGAGDESARQLKTATAEAVLRALSADDRFSLVSLDVKPVVLHPAEGLAPAAEKEITAALEKLAGRLPGGATDLSAVFDVALSRLHGAEQPAVIYVGDGWATSGELSGEALGERLRRALSTSRARFFTVAVGADANQPLLAELARSGGGRAFAVDDTEQATDRALQIAAALKTPTLTELELDLGAGLDETFVSSNGKVSRGEEVTLLARSHHDLPPRAKVRGRLAGKPFERDYPVVYENSVATSFVPRLWAVEAMQRLLGTAADPEEIRGKIISMGLEYGLMTPYTSYIALESEQAYQQRGIPRSHSRLQGARLSALTPYDERRVIADAAGLVLTGAFGCKAESAPPAEQQATARPEMREKADRAPDALEKKSLRSFGESEARAPPQGVPVAPAPAAASGGSAGLGLGVLGGYGPMDDAKAEASRARLAPKKAKERKPADRPLPPPPASAPALCAALQVRNPCSDVARRPLAERGLIWTRRLKTAESAAELVERFQAARSACELDDWRAESRFLQLLQRFVRTPAEASYVLGQFSCQGESRLYLARLLLRRAVDEQFVAAVEGALFESAVDWSEVDLELSAVADPAKRLDKLRGWVARAPDDPNGTIRLIRGLVKSGNAEEALLHARRLHERGLMTPLLLREVGDLLSEQGQNDEAVRTYSEIVEFDSSSLASRRLLGDIYLGHGWYDAAYRQYRTITEAQPADFSGWLRLASAAAGSGRLDEALRLERKVAEAEGTPGPNDPRRWARLASAARLGGVIAAPPAGEGDPAKISEAMKRKLKELQLFQGPGSLVLLTWDDLSVDLTLAANDVAADRGELVDAAAVGLAGAYLPQGKAGDFHPSVRLRGGHRAGAVKLTRHDLEWDGKDFKVVVGAVTLPAGADSVRL